jgi:phosphoribosyl 1,2-cyclic phosphate phosphodiesterase
MVRTVRMKIKNNTANMQITVLGCGGSDGVPQIGCECDVCTSNKPKNIRTRSSIIVDIDGFKILIDSGPDIRLQALREGIKTIDAVMFTHAHFDHIGGLGDLKLFMNNRNYKPIPMFADHETANVTQNTFKYAFKTTSPLYPAILEPHVFSGSFSLLGINVSIIPFRQKHGKYFSYGFRIGDFAYSTDVSGLDEEAYRVLDGVKVWIVDSVRYYDSPTHFCLDDTLKAIIRVNPTEAIITHMCHDIDYDLLSEILPSNIKLAHDGMKFDIKSPPIHCK